jgi:very-short-patch-repair endonuclease
VVHVDVVVGTIAAGQDGLVTLQQARDAGVTDGQVRRRLRTSEWRRVRHGVFVIAGAPPSWEQTILAAVLAAGPGAVASHWSAAMLHGFPDASKGRPEVTAPPGRNPKIRDLRIHRPALLPDYDVRVVDGIPVTSYARTLVDCTGVMSLGQIARALDAGLVRHDVTLWSVERTLSVLGQAPGRHPSKLWTLLGERGVETGLGESRPEMRVFRVIESSDLPAPTQQHQVRFGGDRFRLDLAYPEAKLAIEYDGWDTHRTRSAFDADRRRDRILQVNGWVVLRLTSKTSDAEIVETVRAFVR